MDWNWEKWFWVRWILSTISETFDKSLLENVALAFTCSSSCVIWSKCKFSGGRWFWFCRHFCDLLTCSYLLPYQRDGKPEFDGTYSKPCCGKRCSVFLRFGITCWGAARSCKQLREKVPSYPAAVRWRPYHSRWPDVSNLICSSTIAIEVNSTDTPWSIICHLLGLDEEVVDLILGLSETYSIV